jgi:hypothetical protein
MKRTKLILLLFVSITLNVMADIPQGLKDHIASSHDTKTAMLLRNALERAEHFATAEAAQSALEEVINVKDEIVTAWILTQSKLAPIAIIELEKTQASPVYVRAVCEALREAAPADGAVVWVDGDASDPSLIVASLKELFDSMLRIKTPPLRKGPDGQYHRADVDRWMSLSISQVTASTEYFI